MLCSSRSPLITKHSQMPRSAGVQKNHNIVFFFKDIMLILLSLIIAHMWSPHSVFNLSLLRLTGWISQNQTCEEHAQYATFHPKMKRNIYIMSLLFLLSFFLSYESEVMYLTGSVGFAQWKLLVMNSLLSQT